MCNKKHPQQIAIRVTIACNYGQYVWLINCCYWFMFYTICILSLISENIRAFKKKLNLKFGEKRFESWMYSLKILEGIKYQSIELQILTNWISNKHQWTNGFMFVNRQMKRKKRKKKKEKRRMVLLEYMLCYSLVIGWNLRFGLVIGLNTKILKTSHHKFT